MATLWERVRTALDGRRKVSREVSCEELNQLLIDYVDGTLSSDDHTRLEAHFTDCPNCLAMMKTYRETIAFCRELFSHSMPFEIRTRLSRFLDEKLQEL